MITHLSLGVSDMARATRFYDVALQPLGFARVMEHDGAAGYGPPERPQFWLNAVSAPIAETPGTHVAFLAPSRLAVDEFYAAALAAGGADNGGPGLRPHYHPHYYAAFVIDLDGHCIEAVCHQRP